MRPTNLEELCYLFFFISGSISITFAFLKLADLSLDLRTPFGLSAPIPAF